MRNSLFLFGIWCPIIYSIHMNNGDIGIAHVEPVLNFRIVGHSEGPDLIDHGHTQPHADEVQITFSAFNQKWDLDLLVNHEMFSSKTVFNFSHHEKPELNRILLPDHTLYMSKKDSKPFASVNIYDDGTIHGMIITKNGTYTIDPVHEFPEFDLHSKMAMYHHNDLIHDGLPQHSLSSRSLLQQATVARDANPRGYAATGKSNDETPIGGEPARWANCYPGIEQKFSMGMAVTGEYYAQVCAVVANVANPTQTQKDTACANHLKNLLADSNTIYVPQMGIHLYIEITDIQTGLDRAGAAVNRNPPWNMAQQNVNNPRNSGCGEDAADTLGKLRAWRQTVHPNDAGLWHLMTTCFPAPGTVGIAYLNAICTARVGSGLSSSLSAGNPGSRAIWKVVAHEIGHNFGGGHSFEQGQGTTGGIMDYGDGKLQGVYQFNSQFRQVPMCQLIAGRKANPQTASCFTNYPAENGKKYGYALGAQAACPVTCLTTPATTTTRAYACRECSVDAVNGICTAPVANTAAVADNLCAGNRPNALVEPCNPAPTTPCAANTCGDGRIGGNEQCDPPGTCCNTDCTIKDCDLANDVDACFNSIKNLKTYCFKGDQYNRYNPLVSKVAREESYPRPIAQYWPGLPADFQQGGFDAAIQRKEGRLYLLKGANYAVYELGFGGHNGYPKAIDKGANGANADGLFVMPTGWTKVQAAVSLNSGQGGAYVFGSANGVIQYCRMSFDAGEALGRADRCPNINPLTDWSGGEAFPLANVGGAIRYWPALGATPGAEALNLAVDLIYNGESVTFTFGQGLNAQKTALPEFGSTTTTPGQVDPILQSCSQGCFDCTGNVNICQICDADFQLVSGKCYPIEYVVEMLFDSGTYIQDQVYVASSSVTQNNWNTVQGNTNEAVVLKPNDYIKIDVSTIKSNMLDWEFHFWIKLNPSDTSYETKKINMVAGRLSHGTNNYELSFFLQPKLDQNFQPVVGGQWVPTFRVRKYDTTGMSVLKTQDLMSDFTVLKGTWNHLIATLKNGNMKITIDGGVLQIPYDDEADAGNENKVWRFLAFEIGLPSIPAAAGKLDGIKFSGIDGLLDQFHVDALIKTDDLLPGDSQATSGSPCKLLFIFVAALLQMAIYY